MRVTSVCAFTLLSSLLAIAQDVNHRSYTKLPVAPHPAPGKPSPASGAYFAQPRKNLPPAKSLPSSPVAISSPQPVFRSVNVSPPSIPSGTPQTVSVIAQVSLNTYQVRPRVAIVRVGANGGSQVVGELTETQAGFFSGRLSFNEPAPGQIQLRAVLVSQRSNVAMMAQAPPSSGPIYIQVQSPPKTEYSVRILTVTPSRLQVGHSGRVLVTAIVSPQPVSVAIVSASSGVQASYGAVAQATGIGKVFTALVPVDTSRPGEVALAVSARFANDATPPVTAPFAVAVTPADIATPPIVAANPPAPNNTSAATGTPVDLSQQPAPDPPVGNAPANVQNTQRARGISARVPEGWAWNGMVASAAGPWSSNNFRNEYLHGGFIPDGGCEVEATSEANASRSVSATLASDVPDATMQPARLGSLSALRAAHDDDVAPGLTYRTVAVYAISGNSLYKFFLTFHANEDERACLGGFDEVLSSFQAAQ